MRLATLENEYGDGQLCYFHQDHFLPVEEVGAVFGTFFPNDLMTLLSTAGEFEDMRDWWDDEADQRLPRLPECSTHVEKATLTPILRRPGKIIDCDRLIPASSMIGHGETIQLPFAECVGGASPGFLIRKPLRNFDSKNDDWRNVVAGLVQTITVSTLEETSLSNAHHGFLSVGSILISPDEFEDDFEIARHLEELSQIMTLEPGDLILTGATNLFVLTNDTELSCEFEGLPPLKNPVAVATESSLDTE